MTKAELATKGLGIEPIDVEGRTALIVTDGQYAWDCWEEDYDEAVEQLGNEDVDPGAEDAEYKAYEDLCDLIPYLARSEPDVHKKIVEAGHEYNWS